MTAPGGAVRAASNQPRQLRQVPTWVWSVGWLVVAVSVCAGVWLASGVDLSYAFVVATAGLSELADGLRKGLAARRLVTRAVGFAAGLWLLGFVVEYVTGWGWVDRGSGALGVAITALVAIAAVAIWPRRSSAQS